MALLYWMNIDPLKENGQMHRVLRRCSPLRREKALLLRRQEDQLRSLAATVLLDVALRPYGRQEREMRYDFTQTGKPFFPDLPEFCFSLSHAGEIAVCAVSNREIGVDVEHRRPVSDVLIRRYFSEKERQAAEPMWLWVLKESYGKLTGRGLAELKETELCFQEAVTVCGESVSFWEEELPGGYFAALCSASPETFPPSLREVNRSDLW